MPTEQTIAEVAGRLRKIAGEVLTPPKLATEFRKLADQLKPPAPKPAKPKVATTTAPAPAKKTKRRKA